MWTESSWAFPESYTADDSWIVHSSDGRHGETKVLITHCQGELLHNYYTFGSLHDHDGVVRIFVALSCKLGGFFNYVIILYWIILDYAKQFFPYRECNFYQILQLCP